MNNKRLKTLLYSGILNSIYSLFVIIFFLTYFIAGITSTSDAELFFSVLGVIVVIPHMILFVTGTIFTWLSYLQHRQGFALTAVILHTISLFIFPFSLIFTIPSLILTFIGYFILRRKNKENILI